MIFEKNTTQIVVGQVIIWIESEGFLEMAKRFIHLSRLKQRVPKVVLRDVIVLRDFQGVSEKSFAVLPISELVSCSSEAEYGCRETRQSEQN